MSIYQFLIGTSTLRHRCIDRRSRATTGWPAAAERAGSVSNADRPLLTPMQARRPRASLTRTLALTGQSSDGLLLPHDPHGRERHQASLRLRWQAARSQERRRASVRLDGPPLTPRSSRSVSPSARRRPRRVPRRKRPVRRSAQTRCLFGRHGRGHGQAVATVGQGHARA